MKKIAQMRKKYFKWKWQKKVKMEIKIVPNGHKNSSNEQKNSSNEQKKVKFFFIIPIKLVCREIIR